MIDRASIGSDSLALTQDIDAQSYRDIIVFYNSPFSNRSASFKTSTTMRGIFTTLAVCSFAAASFAATLMPASGVYYPGDINNSGVIHVEFNDSVANPTATISVNGSSVSANMFEEGSTGRFWAVEVQEALQNVVTTNGKAISLTVNGATLPQQTAKYYATLNGKSVKKAATAGLANLIVDNTEAPIYNLNGVKVGESLQNLPAGIYVVNGKKIVIR